MMLGRTPAEMRAEIAARKQTEILRAAEEARKKAEATRRAEIAEGLAETQKDLDPRKMGGKRRVTAKRFCGCVKKVKAQKKKRSEGSAIAICTSSLLWPHGKTLHSVTCRRNKSLKTQKRRATRKK